MIAMIPPPNQTIMKTISNSKVLSSAAVPELKTLAKLVIFEILTLIKTSRK